ncbi:MAG TPA: ribonuclease H-like domain-containing protein [Polyangia bacterium]|nr:ribonuclease H-like domain-containing protein [Polyangia bacterium]
MFSILQSTFQLVPGFGPTRERRLWSAGVAAWSDLLAAPAPVGSGRAYSVLRVAVSDAMAALDRGDVARLARALPRSEHWRLFEAFGTDAAYLDIETGDDVWGRESISAIGFFDRWGPRLLLAGRDLHLFPELAGAWKVLVTFNGLSFDVPILRRAFPDWTPPACHIDLRHVLTRLGHRGGLKRIEEEIDSLNLSRPWHLRGIDGWDACNLFRRGRDGDQEALRLFAEYNLYDVINLRTLMAYAYNAQAQVEISQAPELSARVPLLSVPHRGDVLYDVSKILLEL